MRKIIILTIFTLVLSCSVLVQADEYVDTLVMMQSLKMKRRYNLNMNIFKILY